MSTHVISFRLGETAHVGLLRLAGRIGVSGGEYARNLTLRAVMGVDDSPLKSELDQLRTALRALHDSAATRSDLATVAVALLAHAGKVELSEAKAWAGKHLRRDPNVLFEAD